MLVLSHGALGLALALGLLSPAPAPAPAPAPDPVQELPTPRANAPTDPSKILGTPPVNPLEPSTTPLADTLPDPEPEPEPPSPGIEFAVPPPEGEATQEGPQAPAQREDLDSRWPDPGTAPNDGSGAFVAAAVLVPSAALLTYLLVRPPIREDPQDISTIVVGAGMGGIGLGLAGMGIARRVKLRRWAIAYRVRPTVQGNGMLAGGALALNYGLALTLAGAFGFGGSPSARLAVLLTGIGSLAVLAPPLLVVGKRTHERYLRTGGWYRPPLPPIPVSMSVHPLRGGVGLGVRGRF